MIYLDNSATTAIASEVKDAMISALEIYGNPSSLHKLGLDAHKLLVEARARVAKALGIKSLGAGQLIFTASGTEANNTAIFGSVYAKKRRLSNRIITTDGEHSSVEKSLKRLEEDGFEIVRIPTRGGRLDFEEYKKALNIPPVLVTMMMVNNETGASYDVAKAFKMAKTVSRETVTHCDAVQGFMKCRFTPETLSADMITVSAHKIHGPKGIGALYIDSSILRSKRIIPLVFGGGQEFELRAGTENLLGIIGFGAAAERSLNSIDENIHRMNSLRAFAIERLSALDVKINLPDGAAAPHIVNITLPNIKSETMLHYLSGKDICVSSGSACSSHSKKQSRALIAFGLTEREADCSLRISLGEYNTEEDIKLLCNALFDGINELVRIK